MLRMFAEDGYKMRKSFDIRLALENALYEHLTEDTTLEDMEEIRKEVNSVIDAYIKENGIEKRQ